MQQLRNVIVTGSNKGIGFAIAENLASRGGWNVIMAVRNVQLGEASRKEIIAKHPNAQVHLEKLDISDPNSVTSFIPTIQSKYQQIDLLVNNAGVAPKTPEISRQIVKYTFSTNFYGTIDLTEHMLPLLSTKGKIVSLGSSAGKRAFGLLRNKELKRRFSDPAITKEQLLGLMHEFEQSVESNTYLGKGWPNFPYGISKLGINVYHKILVQHEVVRAKHIQAYVCCPGYVATDMISHLPNKDEHVSVGEGVKTPMHLIDLPFEVQPEIQGGFYFKGKFDSTFL